MFYSSFHCTTINNVSCTTHRPSLVVLDIIIIMRFFSFVNKQYVRKYFPFKEYIPSEKKKEKETKKLDFLFTNPLLYCFVVQTME